MRKVWTGLPILLMPVFAGATILDTPNTPQEQTNWCWAGSSQSVLKFYGNYVKQCEIAEYTRTHAPNQNNMGNQNCCSNPGGSCNQPNYNYGQVGSIQDILRDLGKNPSITNDGVDRKLTQQEVEDNLAKSRPFIMWVKENGGHFIVGRGLENSNLYYMDPWPGEGLGFGPYGNQVNGRTWGGTNVMAVSPGSAPTPKPTSTPTPTPTPKPTATPTPTPKPTTTPTPVPSNMLTLSATGGDGRIDLSWTATGSITSIQVMRDTDANPSGRKRVAIIPGSARSYSDNAVVNGTQYWYWLKYTDANGTTGNSNAGSATPKLTPSPTPTPTPDTPVLRGTGNYPVGFTKCANSGKTCAVDSGTGWVAFGRNGKWVTKNVGVGQQIACTVAAFGSDPQGNPNKCSFQR